MASPCLPSLTHSRDRIASPSALLHAHPPLGLPPLSSSCPKLRQSQITQLWWPPSLPQPASGHSIIAIIVLAGFFSQQVQVPSWPLIVTHPRTHARHQSLIAPNQLIGRPPLTLVPSVISSSHPPALPKHNPFSKFHLALPPYYSLHFTQPYQPSTRKFFNHHNHHHHHTISSL